MKSRREKDSAIDERKNSREDLQIERKFSSALREVNTRNMSRSEREEKIIYDSAAREKLFAFM